MIYIHGAGFHHSEPGDKPPDLAAELKSLSGKSYRRIDRFIRLALIGAHKAVAGYELQADTALYLTSGQGDLPVFERVRRQRYFQKMMSKPVDFVNLASNIAGFYVASHLGLDGANLFLSHKHFPVQMALLLAQSELESGKQPAILLGGVDASIENRELARKLLGVGASTPLGEGSNWLLLQSESGGALASLSVDCRQLTLSQVKSEIGKLESGYCLAFAGNFPTSELSELINFRKDLPCLDGGQSWAYYETQLLYVINRFLSEPRKTPGKLLYIDSDGDRFMVVRVAV